MNKYNEDLSGALDGYQSFCEGTGLILIKDRYYSDVYGYVEILYYDEGTSKQEIISLLPIVDDVYEETYYFKFNASQEGLNACKEFFLNDAFGGGDISDAQDGYQSFCEGTGTIADGYSIFSDAVIGEFGDGLIERNVFTQVEEIPQVVEITNYDETCGTDVIIPSTIEGLPVTRIADEQSGTPATQISANRNNLKNNTLYNKNTIYGVRPIGSAINGVFSYKGITSVKFPNTLEYIGDSAFRDSNYLTEVIIPDSVTTIGTLVFEYNNITNVEVGTGITSIGEGAFDSNPLVTVNIKSNPSLGSQSFYAEYPSDFVSPIDADYLTHFKVFQYNGTCAELNQYTNVFANYAMPQQIITSDTNSCTYTGPTTAS